MIARFSFEVADCEAKDAGVKRPPTEPTSWSRHGSCSFDLSTIFSGIAVNGSSLELVSKEPSRDDEKG